MLPKEKRIVITFKNTVEVMRMEETARRLHLSGRIIPIPGSVSAGCGLCFMARPEDEALLTDVMRENGISWERIVPIML